MKCVLLFVIVFFYSCVGIDYKDDAIRDEQLNLIASSKLIILDKIGTSQMKGISGNLSLSVGDQEVVSVEYYDQYGIKKETPVKWVIADPTVVSILNNEITALASGNTLINGNIGSVSVTINLTVVSNNTQISNVTILSPTKTRLVKNDTVRLMAITRNIQNTIITGKNIEWFTNDPKVVTISSTGLVTAIADGITEVYVQVDGIKSNTITFMVNVSNPTRAGTFQSTGGYSASGSVSLEENPTKLILTLSDGFSASMALGTYIYLANTTIGSNVKSAGLELGTWTPGVKNFDIAGVTLNQYKYVVVLCKPAGITFGFAELKP